jgi:hypothetical protein
MKRRTPLQRQRKPIARSPLKRSTKPIRARLKTAQVREHDEQVRHAIIIRSGQRCNKWAPENGVDWIRGQRHEKVYRSHLGEISESNCIWICPGCHNRVHNYGKDGNPPCPRKPRPEEL